VVDSLSSRDLAARTLVRVREALHSGEAVGLPELIKLIQIMASDPQGVDITTLAEIIQKDAVMLAKILGAAQTLAYNLSGAEVTSVAQAIHLVGYKRIRNITMTLLVVATGARAHGTEKHREAATAAVCSGFIAESIAGELGICDREEAYVGGCLRNLGEIVLAAYMPEDCRAARSDHGGDSEERWRSVFGMTPLEVGRELLRQENAPAEIIRVLAEFDPRAQRPGSAFDPLAAVCELATRLAGIGIEPGDSEIAVPKLEALVEEYGEIFPGIGGRAEALLATAATHLKDFLRERQITSLPEAAVSRFVRRAHAGARKAEEARKAEGVRAAKVRQEALAAGVKPALAATGATPAKPAPAGAPQVPAAARGAVAATAPAEAPTTARSSGLADWSGAQERLRTLMDEPGVAAPRVLAQAAQLLRSGFEASETLIFTGSEPDGSVRLSLGSGEFFLQLPGQVAANPAERTVAGVCLKMRENVLIHDARDAAIAAHLPEWLKGPGAPRSFALFPLPGTGRLAGFALVGWSLRRPLSITSQAGASLAKFLRLLGEYCEGPLFPSKRDAPPTSS
jgi:HD-like signal output (HDOD) protein